MGRRHSTKINGSKKAKNEKELTSNTSRFVDIEVQDTDGFCDGYIRRDRRARFRYCFLIFHVTWSVNCVFLLALSG